MKCFRWVLYFSWFIFSSCTQPPTQSHSVCSEDALNRKALFEVGEVTGNVTIRNSSVNKEIILDFEACISDATTYGSTSLRAVPFTIRTFEEFNDEPNQSLFIEPFTISGDSQKNKYVSIKRDTDSKGCLNWKETYPYQIPKKQRWIYFERVFESSAGQVVVPMIVNPYLSENNNKFYDIRPEFNNIKRLIPSGEEESLYKMHDDLGISYTSQNKPTEECLRKRSLDIIFQHLSEEEQAPVYAEAVSINLSPIDQEQISGWQINKTRVATVNSNDLIANSRSFDKVINWTPRGRFFNLELEVPVRQLSRDIYIGDRLLPINQGEFEVTAMLFYYFQGNIAGSEDRYFSLHQPTTSSASISQAETPLKLDFRNIHIPFASQEGEIRLFLKIKSTSKGMISKNPVYYMYKTNNRQIEDLSSQQTLRLITKNGSDKPLDNAYVKSIYDKNYNQKPKLGENGFYSLGISLKLERMRFGRIVSNPLQCESVVQRAVRYLGEVRLQDSMKNNGPLINRKMKICTTDLNINFDCQSNQREKECVREDQEKCGGEVSSDEYGIIKFDQEITHKVYDTQKFLVRRITFEVPGFAPKSRVMAFLPWEYGFLTYQDITQQYERWVRNKEDRPNSLKSLLESELEPPALRLNEYRSAAIEPSYEITNSLDITTVKNSIFLLRPNITRYDSFGRTKRNPPLVMPNGYWLLRMIFVKGPQETNAGIKKIIRPEMGIWESWNTVNRDPVRQSYHQSQCMRQSYQMFQSFVSQENNINQRTEEDDRPLSGLYQSTINNIINRQLNHDSCLDTNSNASAFSDIGDDCTDIMNPNCNGAYEPSDYIFHYDTLAYSENGVISAFVNYKFKTEQFRLLGSKNAVILQVFPIDPAKIHQSTKQPLIQRRKNSCEIDVKKSRFVPYMDHDLVTKPHWGTVTSSDFGFSNFLRPIEESLLINLVAPAGDQSGKFLIPHIKDVQLDGLERVSELHNLRMALTQWEDFQRGQSLIQPEFVNSKLTDIQQDIKSQDGINSYCTQTDVDDEYLQSCLCISQYEDVKNESTDIQDKNSDLIQVNFQIPSSEKIRKCIYASNVYKEMEKISNLPSVQPDAQKQMYCSRSERFQFTDVSGKSTDRSNSSQIFRQCVCNQSSDDSLPTRMADCFAKDRMLTVIHSDQSDFLDQLNQVIQKINQVRVNQNQNMPPAENFEYRYFEDTYAGSERKHHPNLVEINSQDLEQFIQEGFNESNREEIKQGSFLHSMCYFWFDPEGSSKLMNPELIKNHHQYYKENYRMLQEKKITSNQSDTVPDMEFDQWSELEAKNPFKLLNYHFMTSDPSTLGHPLWRCIRNPLLFFHIERKVMVGSLSDQKDLFQYKKGHIYSFLTDQTDGASAQEEWSKRIAINLSGETKLSFASDRTISKILNFISKIGFGAGVRTSVDSSQQDQNAFSRRGDTRASKSISLAVNQIKARLAFRSYKSCMLIRPRILAFDGLDSIWSNQFAISANKDDKRFIRYSYQRAGFLMCNTETKNKSEPLEVDEDYYYVQQFFGGNSYEFMSRTIHHNRPFIQILRGKNHMDQFEIALRGHQYKTWSGQQTGHALYQKANQIDQDLIKKFESVKFDSSGFLEGIYTYPDDDHYLYFVKDRQPIEPTRMDSSLKAVDHIDPDASRDIRVVGGSSDDEVEEEWDLDHVQSFITEGVSNTWDEWVAEPFQSSIIWIKERISDFRSDEEVESSNQSK